MKKEKGVRVKEEIQFKRNLSHNYLIIKGIEKEEDFQLKMLLHNQIEGLLEIQKQIIDGEVHYYYEISSKQPMTRFFEKIDIDKDQLVSILWEINDVMERMKEYMMDGTYLIFDPNYLYFDVETMKIGLIFYPDYDKTLKESFCELVEYVLEKINHNEEKGVFIAYQLYKITRKPNFTWFQILSILEQGNRGNQEDINKENDNKREMIIQEKESESNKNNNQNHIEEEDTPHIKNHVIEAKHIHTKSKSALQEMLHKYKIMGLGFLFIIMGIITLVLELFAFETGIIIIGLGTMVLTYSVIQPILIKRRFTNEEDIKLEETYPLPNHKNEWDYHNNRTNQIKNDNKRNQIQENNRLEKQNQIESINRKSPYSYEEEQEKENIEIKEFFPKQNNSHGNTTLLGTEMNTEERKIRYKIKGKEVEYSLENLPVTIGKMKELVDITLNDKEVSRIHARFIEKNNQVYLEDLNSTNGTYKNGISLETNERVLVEKEDEIVIGKNSFIYY